MAVNTDYELAYEHIGLVLQEFETQALRTGKREAILAIVNAPLSRADQLLRTSQRSFNGLSSLALGQMNQTQQEEEDLGYEGSIQGGFREGLRAEGGLSGAIDIDEDLAELFGGPDNPFGKYLEECLDCSLRLKFDFQLKPTFLLKPINSMIDEINGSLDMIEARLDPFKTLEQLCVALDAFKSWCIPDIIMVLMSLKMLLKRYMTNVLKVQFDWTAILGPILKAIVEGVSLLLDNLLHVVLTPLDCSLGSLGTSNRLYRESIELAEATKDFGTFGKDIFEDVKDGVQDFKLSNAAKGLSGSLFVKDIRWEKDPDQKVDNASPNFQNVTIPDPGQISVNARLLSEAKKKGATSILSGLTIDSDFTLTDALKSPAFKDSTIFEKMIYPLLDFSTWIRQTVENIINSFKSLSSLVVGEGLVVNIENLGVMLFLTDMISVVMMIIRMLKSNPGESDWCRLLQENPELLESQLRGRFGNVRIERLDEGSLVLFRGPQAVGTISTCHAARSPRDQDLIQSWIDELNNRGS